jgi:hypothetical protein
VSAHIGVVALTAVLWAEVFPELSYAATLKK